MSFNNQHLDDDGYEADKRVHAKKDDALMEIIEAEERLKAFPDNIYLPPTEQYFDSIPIHRVLNNLHQDDIEYIRADKYKELEKTVKEAMKAVDLMIIDRDAFHDDNVKIEKKLETKEMMFNSQSARILSRDDIIRNLRKKLEIAVKLLKKAELFYQHIMEDTSIGRNEEDYDKILNFLIYGKGDSE